MADLRIVDAPVLLQESITDDVKMPTGGLGNYAIRLGDLVWYVITKEQLANKNYVDLSSKGVKDSLDEHVADKANPHQVTKAQVGLGNVDNTADIDKPVSNAVSSAIITATNDMATKTYVNSKDGDLTTLTTTNKTNLVKAINEVVNVKANKSTTLTGYGISDAYTKSEIATDYGGVKTLYDRNVAAGAGLNGWTDLLIQLESGRTQREKNKDSVSVKDFGAKGDGVTDDAPALQNLANSVDIDLKAYMFFPFYNNNYKLGSTVVIQEPMMLWGDAVPTYNRGNGKRGKILLDTPIGFNLGNGRTTGAVLDLVTKTSKNPADQWTVKNLAFLPFNTVTQNNTQVAIMHDSKTNGPDRGFLLREVSGRNLKHVIHVKNNDVQTHLANLEVVNCCLSNNALPILADGNVFGARIVGNQIEQNSQGAIHGVFHASLAIHDNMLESNVNTIYIKDHPQDRNGCNLSLERNYFEGNLGDYLVKMESFQSNSIISRGNYTSGFLSSDGITPNTSNGRPKDHFLLTNSYSSIYIYDRLSVSFFGSAGCPSDNNLSRFFVYSELSQYVRVLSRWDDAVEMRDNSASLTSVAVKLNTDIGEIYGLKKANSYTDVPLVVQANDCVHLCFSYYADDALLAPTHITIVEAGAAAAVLVSQAGFSAAAANGGVVTCNYIFTVPTNATGGRTFRFNLTLNDASKTMSIVGASAKKIGTYNASATNKVANRFIVTKSKPPVTRVSDGAKFTQVLASTDVTAATPIVKTYTVTGVTANNRVEILLGVYSADLQVSAIVSAADTIQVTIKNTSSATVNIPDGTKLTYVVY